MKKKFFLCLRPMVIEEKDTKPRLLDRSDDGVLTIKSSVSDNESLKVSYPRREKGSSRPNFCRVLKAILFQVSLKKRVRNRRVYQLTLPSKTNLISDVSTDKSVSRDLPESNIQKPRPNLTVSASLSSSLCSSSTSEAKNFRLLSIKKSLARSQSNSFNQKRQTLTNYTVISCLSSSNSVLFSILVALFFTIFWGKLCAILFTSAWLYFLPGRSVSHHRPETITKLPETETSRDNKKRVIMEGLLERNHHFQRALNFPLER